MFKNLRLFMENKDPGDDLFDRLTVSKEEGRERSEREGGREREREREKERGRSRDREKERERMVSLLYVCTYASTCMCSSHYKYFTNVHFTSDNIAEQALI